MRKLTGPWLVMITATLIFVPLLGHAGDLQGNAISADAGEDAHGLSPALSARAGGAFHAAPPPADHGVVTRGEAPGSVLTLRQATIDLPGKHETLIRAVRYPDLLALDDGGGMPCWLVETPFFEHPLLIDARLRQRGPPSSSAIL